MKLRPIMQYPELYNLLTQYPQHNWECVKKIEQFRTMPNTTYGRTGESVFPFKNTGATQFDLTVPIYDSTFAKTFADVTDEQCNLWLQQKSNRPWAVCWSGGIDSTVIVAAILKNTMSADRENIHIVCDRASVYENPDFFYDHVRPNFKIIDVQTKKMNQLYDTYYVIDGILADQLYCGQAGVGMTEEFPGSLDFNCRTNPDTLLNYIASKIDRPFAEWYYEHMMVNINSVNIPIETYYDFWWWQFFNYVWSDHVIQHNVSALLTSRDSNSIKQYLDNHLFWYGTADYQQWSMNNNQNKTKYGSSLAETKLPSKQYIYNFDHNEYYRVFKTKQDSTSRPRYNSNEICVLDDYSFLFPKDISQILELLPEHINAV
jgi:hypothetical protein